MSAGGRNWRREAVCFQETSCAPEEWTPNRQPVRAVRKSMESLCHRCPVLRRCADDALTAQAEGGLFAGVWMPERGDRGKWDEAAARLRVIAGRSSQLEEEYLALETSA